MIPEERLSTVPIVAQLTLPNPQPEDLVSREWGGVALGNATQGLLVKVWTCTVNKSGDPLVPDQVLVEAEDVSSVVIFTDFNILTVSLAFDQNAQPTIAYMSGSTAKLYWYDSLIEDFKISTFEQLHGTPGSEYPKCTLDDHRAFELNTSDIIICYMRDGNLYFIAQRDRYQDEYLLYADLNGVVPAPRVDWVRMNEQLRLEIRIRGNFSGG